ncbi:MAG: MmcQ/YjbR family DNA-binding protein [Acidimicrobiales bacterium]
MATFDDVARIVAELPEVTESARYGRRGWSVGRKTFAWERPLTKADLKRLAGAPPPEGPILAVMVDDMSDREAALAAAPAAFFTIAHFDGYPAVLVKLRKVSERALRDALVDAWLACAPPKLAEEHLRRLLPKGRPHLPAAHCAPEPPGIPD